MPRAGMWPGLESRWLKPVTTVTYGLSAAVASGCSENGAVQLAPTCDGTHEGRCTPPPQ